MRVCHLPSQLSDKRLASLAIINPLSEIGQLFPIYADEDEIYVNIRAYVWEAQEV